MKPAEGITLICVSDTNHVLFVACCCWVGTATLTIRSLHPKVELTSDPPKPIPADDVCSDGEDGKWCKSRN